MAKKRRGPTDAEIRAFIGEEKIANHERVQRELAEFSAILKRREEEAWSAWEAEQAKKAF